MKTNSYIISIKKVIAFSHFNNVNYKLIYAKIKVYILVYLEEICIVCLR